VFFHYPYSIRYGIPVKLRDHLHPEVSPGAKHKVRCTRGNCLRSKPSCFLATGRSRELTAAPYELRSFEHREWCLGCALKVRRRPWRLFLAPHRVATCGPVRNLVYMSLRRRAEWRCLPHAARGLRIARKFIERVRLRRTAIQFPSPLR
jgi:hypothetical protein